MASTASQHSERAQQQHLVQPLHPALHPKAMKAVKASFKCWMQLAAAHAAGVMPAGVAFVPAPMAMMQQQLMMQQQFVPRHCPPSAPPPRPAPAKPQPPQPPRVQSRAPAAVPAAGGRAGSSNRALPARKRPIEEMRKLQRVLLKLLPASEAFNPEGVHLSQITVGGIRSYLDQTLGDAPAVAWHQDTYYSYLRRLFIWATGRSDITIQAAADCVWLKPGHGWVLREDRLAELGVNWQQWQVPLRREHVHAANSVLAPAAPEAAVQPQLQLQPAAPEAAATLPPPPPAAGQQQEQLAAVVPAAVQHAASPSAAPEQLAAADCAATTTAACVQQGQQQPPERAMSEPPALARPEQQPQLQQQEEQVQPMQVCEPATQGVQGASPAAAPELAEPQQQQKQQQQEEEGSQKPKAAAKRPAEDDSTSSSSSSSTSSSLPPAKRRAVQAAPAGSAAGAAAAAGAKKQQAAAARPCIKIDPCVLAAARVIVSLKKAHSL